MKKHLKHFLIIMAVFALVVGSVVLCINNYDFYNGITQKELMGVENG